MKKRLIIWGLVALLIGSFFGFGSVGAENRIWIERAFRLTTTILNTAHTWVSSQTFTTVDINGGTIDGTTVGATTPAAGAFTTVKATTDAAVGLILKSDASGNLSYIDPSVAANLGLSNALNPKGMAQGVHMTAAASGSNGIQVADDDNIDFGTGNFTLVWRGSLPDWTPVAEQYLNHKYVGGVGYSLAVSDTSTGLIKVYVNSHAYLSSVAPSVIDGTFHEIVAVVTVGTTNTLVDFYVDGALLGTQQTFANPGSVSNTNSSYFLGTDTLRNAGTTSFAATFNRALTAAQVLALYRNGIDFADKWGSQTNILTGDSVNFEGNTVGSWLPGAAESSVSVNATTPIAGTYDLKIDNGTSLYGGAYIVVAVVSGEKYRVTLSHHTTTVWRVGGKVDYNWTSNDIFDTTFTLTGDGATYTASYEFTAISSGNCCLQFGTYTSGSALLYVDSLSFSKIGATLALQPEGMQPAPGQCLDSSTNKNHGMQPATGSSLIRPKRDFEINWTNTWSGTTESQYIGGINQAILAGSPASGVTPYITEMWGAVSGTTIEDVIYGDGSDTDRWVAITTGLASGITKFTVANPTPDGVNYKMIIAPDAAFTGSIRTTVRGVLLQ